MPTKPSKSLSFLHRRNPLRIKKLQRIHKHFQKLHEIQTGETFWSMAQTYDKLIDEEYTRINAIDRQLN